MKYMPRISVIVPVYNVEKYLHRCVDSILGQTFTDFELILVDDGSPDNCGAICDEYAAKDARVRVIHQENQGQAAARNRAVTEANGEWIHFVDSDDVIHPQMLEVLYSAVIENDANIGMCGAIESENIPGNSFCVPQRKTTIYNSDEESTLKLYLQGKHRYWVVWGKLIRKEIIFNNMFIPGRIYEDNAVVVKWLYDAGRIADVDDQLYYYFVNKEGTTKKAISKRNIDQLWALNEQIVFFEQIGYNCMKQKICSLYVQIASVLYKRFSESEELCSFSKEQKRRLIKFVILNRNSIVLSKKEKTYVMDNLYPSLMRWYWMVQKGITKLFLN